VRLETFAARAGDVDFGFGLHSALSEAEGRGWWKC
jgi:hypothetical protein